MSTQLIAVKGLAKRFAMQKNLQTHKEWALYGNIVRVAEKHPIHLMTSCHSKRLVQGAETFQSDKRF